MNVDFKEFRVFDFYLDSSFRWRMYVYIYTVGVFFSFSNILYSFLV